MLKIFKVKVGESHHLILAESAHQAVGFMVERFSVSGNASTLDGTTGEEKSYVCAWGVKGTYKIVGPVDESVKYIAMNS